MIMDIGIRNPSGEEYLKTRRPPSSSAYPRVERKKTLPKFERPIKICTWKVETIYGTGEIKEE